MLRAATGLGLVLGLAACGRFGFSTAPAADGAIPSDDDASVDAAMVDAAMSDAVVARTVTLVSGLSPLPLGDLDLGVTGTPAGFTLTFAASAGSDMYGVNFDAAMRPDADWRSTSATNTYVGTTMTWTGSPMTTMTTNDRLTYIKRYEPNLASYTETDNQEGVGAKPTYATAGLRWFYAIVDSTVLHLREIASDGTPIGNVIDIPGGVPAGIPFGGALGGEGTSLYAIWSHMAGTCQWAIANVGATISHTDGAIAATCLTPRLAVEPGRAVAVFDDGASVRAVTLASGSGVGAAATIAMGGDARIDRASSGGYWLAWQGGFALRVALYTPGQGLTNQATVDLPIGLQTYELVTASNHTYLFAAANRQLWWAQLD